MRPILPLPSATLGGPGAECGLGKPCVYQVIFTSPLSAQLFIIALNEMRTDFRLSYLIASTAEEVRYDLPSEEDDAGFEWDDTMKSEIIELIEH